MQAVLIFYTQHNVVREKLHTAIDVLHEAQNLPD